ncbi:hypothetical protein E2C01_000282 [Portunus trituberculatus]|uniref:Uncharacterized protein n=1 Tax=Portunus trituberculatus TaxID=210409 RepID=A0A5B7CEI1_PORTR|nr:hypothetical protein [Portunus trituberculatus]
MHINQPQYPASFDTILAPSLPHLSLSSFPVAFAYFVRRSLGCTAWLQMVSLPPCTQTYNARISSPQELNCSGALTPDIKPTYTPTYY